ncbi:MAG: ATP-binding cassette domain-containing protein [Anaerolineae bacterium]|jgi:ABC-2 type transport system ATP-binding protein|nr:ATP-binding cassette domain-containing protein [Anaerolineae bacterium]
MGNTPYAVVVDGVKKSFGSVTALAGVSLKAETGKVLGLLGPNGAGKTTIVRILTTLLQPDAGTATVAGIDVVKNPGAARRIFGLAGQYPAVDEMLTGRENLNMVGRLYHMPRQLAKQRADELLERFALTDAANRPIRTYSGGMRRRLDLAAALVVRPQVLFLDEPTTGLDPRTRMELWDVIRELVADGATLLLTTQYLEEADALADHIAIIDRGLLIAEGTADQLKGRLQKDVVQVRVTHPDHAQSAYEALKVLGNGSTQLDATSGWISVPVPHGPQGLVEAVRLLDERKVAIADISLRRPSLDDVFLTLTGKPTAGE